MKNLIEQIKNAVPDLKRAEIEGVLYLIRENQPSLSNKQGISNNELIRQTGLPKEILKTFKSSITFLLENPEKDEIVLNDYGKKNLDDIELKSYKWSLVSYTDKKVEDEIIEIRKKYCLEPKREYDQFFATPQTSVSKAAILIDKDMVEGRNILLLGDDDLVSITLGLMGAPFNKITVLDIDDSILSTIRKIAEEKNIKNIYTKIYDARKPLDKSEIANYDIVMSDPPYTPSGISLFLRRGIECLKPHKDFSGKYVFLCYSNSLKGPERSIKMQEIIQNYNLVIEDKIDKFNRYYGAESIGSSSSIYILKITPSTKITDEYLGKPIYTYEGKKEDKFPYVDHFTFKLFDVPKRIIASKKQLLKALGDLCNKHRFKIVDSKITHFKGEGLTVTLILANSNLLVHTWPEYNAIHIDLITCVPIQNRENLVYNVSRLFETKSMEVRKVE